MNSWKIFYVIYNNWKYSKSINKNGFSKINYVFTNYIAFTISYKENLITNMKTANYPVLF